MCCDALSRNLLGPVQSDPHSMAPYDHLAIEWVLCEIDTHQTAAGRSSYTALHSYILVLLGFSWSTETLEVKVFTSKLVLSYVSCAICSLRKA